MSFGKKLKEIRIAKDVSLRKLADMIGVTAPYLCDVENERRNPLSPEHLNKVAEALALNEKEREDLFDAAAKSRGSAVPSDVILYAGEVKTISAALRKARELNLGDEEWLQIIEEMEKKRK